MSDDLGRVRVLGADAVGQPGQRRFRLFVQSGRGSALLWTEKERLNSLSIAIDQALAQLTEGQILRTEASASGVPALQTIPEGFPSTPTFEYQVGPMRLTYDEAENLFTLAVTPLEMIIQGQEALVHLREEDELSLSFTQQQAHVLSQGISAVVSSGRPVCPLCGTPLDGGPHACVRQNGHREIQFEEEGE